MTEEQTQPDKTPKLKRTRKPSKPRAPRVKDEGILAIEKEAADKKAKYRLAQQSGGILKRIFKLKERLTASDRQKLLDDLMAAETPALPINSSPSAASDPLPAPAGGWPRVPSPLPAESRPPVSH